MGERINDLVEKYVQLRDKKAEIDKSHREKVAKFNAAMGKIEAFLGEYFNDIGVESIRTSSGTAFRSTETTVKVDDRDAFLAFVRDSDAWAFLESRANKSAVDEYLKANEELPPGVSVTRRSVIRIHRS
jgi:hypothetical protein